MSKRNYFLPTGKPTDPLSRKEPSEVYLISHTNKSYARPKESKPTTDSQRTSALGSIVATLSPSESARRAATRAREQMIQLYGRENIDLATGELTTTPGLPGEYCLLVEILGSNSRAQEYLSRQLEEAKRQLAESLTTR